MPPKRLFSRGYAPVSPIDPPAPASNHPGETLEMFLDRILGSGHTFKNWFGQYSVIVEHRLRINSEGKSYIYDPVKNSKDLKFRIAKWPRTGFAPPRPHQRTYKNGPVTVHVHGIHTRIQRGVPGLKARREKERREVEEVLAEEEWFEDIDVDDVEEEEDRGDTPVVRQRVGSEERDDAREQLMGLMMAVSGKK